MARWSAEDTDGRLEAVLSNPISRRGVLIERAAGLMIGALSHYRFIGVIVVGFIALLLLPQGRRMLRDPRVWVALAVGVLAWLPLLSWNADNQDEKEGCRKSYLSTTLLGQVFRR